MTLLPIRFRVKKLFRHLYSLFSISPLLFAIPLILLLLSKPAAISDGHRSSASGPEYPEISLLFIGDIMQHMPQVEAAWNDSLNRYVYDSCFQYVAPIISTYDFAIANFETTLAGKPYSGYPAFSSPDALVSGLIKAGVDIVGTANNHCCDRGFTGIRRTVTILDSLGLKHMGTYRNETEYRKTTPLIIRKNGITLALLNYTYGTNGIPVPDGTVVSIIEKERLFRDLKTARDSQPDKVILFIHWGEEYQREPNAFQKDIAAWCFANGADIIIGSHPHVIQPMEWHKEDSLQQEKLVVWSLGNCVSNQRKRYTDGGAMFGLTLRKENGKTIIIQVDYQLTWVYNPLRYDKKQYYILPVANYENDSNFMNRESFSAMKQFASDSRELLNGNLNIQEKR